MHTNQAEIGEWGRWKEDTLLSAEAGTRRTKQNVGGVRNSVKHTARRLSPKHLAEERKESTRNRELALSNENL